MSHRAMHRRLLQLESLEHRSLLAGNVNVNVIGNTLQITGDGQDNQIAVIQLGNQRYAVLGVNTTVNGPGNFEFAPNMNVSSIIANLGSGNDMLGLTNNAIALGDLAEHAFGVDLESLLDISLTDLQAELDQATQVNDFALPGSLIVNGGDGDDLIGVVGDIGGVTRVNLGSGSGVQGSLNAFAIDGSSLQREFAQVGGLISVVGGSRSDFVGVYDVDVRSSILATLGEGALNGVDLIRSNVGGSVLLTTGAGNDFLQAFDTNVKGALTAFLGDGQNSVQIDESAIGFATVITGKHVDSIDLIDTSIAYSLVVQTGGGDDLMTAQATNVGFNAALDFGAGNDVANLISSSFSYLLTVLMQLGNDHLSINDCSARLAALFGGFGQDQLTIGSPDLFALPYWDWEIEN